MTAAASLVAIITIVVHACFDFKNSFFKVVKPFVYQTFVVSAAETRTAVLPVAGVEASTTETTTTARPVVEAAENRAAAITERIIHIFSFAFLIFLSLFGLNSVYVEIANRFLDLMLEDVTLMLDICGGYYEQN